MGGFFMILFPICLAAATTPRRNQMVFLIILTGNAGAFAIGLKRQYIGLFSRDQSTIPKYGFKLITAYPPFFTLPKNKTSCKS